MADRPWLRRVQRALDAYGEARRRQGWTSARSQPRAFVRATLRACAAEDRLLALLRVREFAR